MRIGNVDIDAKTGEKSEDKIISAMKTTALRTNITEAELRSSLGADIYFRKD